MRWLPAAAIAVGLALAGFAPSCGSGAVAAAKPAAARPAAAPAPKYTGDMPAFDASEWLNSPPLTRESLKGKVVLVDFWEYTCVNCLRTLPYVKAWWSQYHDAGLVVVGVHAPEFDFGKQDANVKKGVAEFGLTYPIALDNDFKTWDAYDNHAWPAKYLFDADGKLVGKWMGEGDYPEIEAAIRLALLERNGSKAKLPPVTEATRAYDEDFAARRGITGETYLGTARRHKGAVKLQGEWKDAPEYVEYVGPSPGKIVLEFTAGEVNLVMQPGASGKADVTVKLDGDWLDGAGRGADVGEDGHARFGESRMIRLVKGVAKARHTLVLETNDPGLRAYAFTFGP